MTDPTHLQDKARVRYFQERFNFICARRNIPHVKLVVDGIKGPATQAAIKLLKRCFGVLPRNADTSLDNPFIEHLKEPFHKNLYRKPGQWARGAAYRTYLRQLAKKHEGSLQDRVLRQARALIGVMEHGGNNAGEQVTRIIRANGGTGPEPWCGDFVAFCYRAAGSKAVQRAWAAAWALGRLAGQQQVSSPRPGDIVVYTWQHTGIFVRSLGGGQIETIEGNTGRTGAVSDSTTGGDGVYLKHRSTSQVMRYVRVTR